MARIGSSICTLAAALLIAPAGIAQAVEPLQVRAAKAIAVLNGAEGRFQPPAAQWFHDRQAKLRQDVAVVDAAFAAMPPKLARDWRSHLHWHLLEPNLQSGSVNLDDLQVVRRWLYSNYEGLEGPQFADVRESIDAFLDAALTFAQVDLQGKFVGHVTSARKQIKALAQDPSDANAAALGQTLGWFERSGQLRDEVTEIRNLLSLPNSQIAVSSDLIKRVLQLFETEISQSLPLASTEVAPPSGILRRERVLHVRGTAHSTGSTTLEVIANPDEAEISLMFAGNVVANCRADAGPAVLSVRTAGPVEAVKPIFLSTDGLRVGEAQVDSKVRTNLQSISARSNIVKLIAQRRADEPQARAHMHSSAHGRTTELLAENLDQRVDEGIAQIQAEIETIRRAMGGFSEVLAPAVREGAVPRLDGLRSTADSIEVNVVPGRRHQLGAPEPYIPTGPQPDVEFRVHVSMFNNTLETILGGKRLSDEFLMKYSQVLQAQLPLPLMVHARAPRWGITTVKQRPLELSLPAENRLMFVMRIASVDLDGQTYNAPATATISYDLSKNEFGDYRLVRDGEVVLQTELPTAARALLLEKLSAFFAPVLDAGGIAIPDGGVLGLLNGVEPAGVHAVADWIVIGVNIPDEVLEAVMEFRGPEEDQTTQNPSPQERQEQLASIKPLAGPPVVDDRLSF